MKLTYSILWFDDDEEYFNSLEHDDIKDGISKLGFDCSIKFVTDADDFLQESPFKDYDLILVDYSIDPGNNQYGQEFIKSVREQEVLTEIILYSSHGISELWDAAKSESLDGIFFASRQNRQNIDKLLKVAKHSIQKVLDLENVRGIVMAEVGSNDERLSLIAKAAFSKLTEEEKIQQVNKYIGYMKKQYNSFIGDVDSLTDSIKIDDLLESLDSTKKWELCVSLSKKVDGLNINDKGDYKTEVLNKRNFLAHGLPKKLDDGALKFMHRDKEYTFNDAESLSLRESLQKYGEFFESVVKEK